MIEMDKFAHEDRVEATLSTESEYHYMARILMYATLLSEYAAKLSRMARLA